MAVAVVVPYASTAAAEALPVACGERLRSIPPIQALCWGGRCRTYCSALAPLPPPARACVRAAAMTDPDPAASGAGGEGCSPEVRGGGARAVAVAPSRMASSGGMPGGDNTLGQGLLLHCALVAVLSLIA